MNYLILYWRILNVTVNPGYRKVFHICFVPVYTISYPRFFLLNWHLSVTFRFQPFPHRKFILANSSARSVESCKCSISIRHWYLFGNDVWTAASSLDDFLRTTEISYFQLVINYVTPGSSTSFVLCEIDLYYDMAQISSRKFRNSYIAFSELS